MKRPASLAAVLLLAVAVTPAFSQVGVYLGGFAGTSSQKPSFEGVRFDRDTTFLYGVRAGVQVLMLAFEFNYFQAGHNVAMDEVLLFDWDGIASDYGFVGGNLRIMAPIMAVRPFLALGYGSYTVDLDGVGSSRRSGLNFGAGIEVKLGRIGIIGEGKWQAATFDLDDFDVRIGDFTLSVGLNVYL